MSEVPLCSAKNLPEPHACETSSPLGKYLHLYMNSTEDLASWVACQPVTKRARMKLVTERARVKPGHASLVRSACGTSPPRVNGPRRARSIRGPRTPPCGLAPRSPRARSQTLCRHPQPSCELNEGDAARGHAADCAKPLSSTPTWGLPPE